MTKKEYIDSLKVPEQVMQKIIEEMKVAEQEHYFDEMFIKEIPLKQYPTKEDFLNSFCKTMRLNKSTFIKIYSYEMDYHGFAELALSRLESLGCSKARSYYDNIISEYEQKSKEEMKKAAEWYRKRIEQDYERREKKLEWTQVKNRKMEQDWMNGMF